MADPVRLLTQRLLIRDQTMADLETHHRLLSDPVTMRYLPDIMTATLAESEENLRVAVEEAGTPGRSSYFFRIEESATGEYVGQIGYTVTEVTPMGKLAGVGYFTRSAFWGRGYVTEALEAVMAFAFHENDVYRLSCGCLAENVGSERVMVKCGMTKEAAFREYQWHEGKLKDRVEYRMLRNEYNAKARG